MELIQIAVGLVTGKNGGTVAMLFSADGWACGTGDQIPAGTSIQPKLNANNDG
jgi:hypothetical protein